MSPFASMHGLWSTPMNQMSLLALASLAVGGDQVEPDGDDDVVALVDVRLQVTARSRTAAVGTTTDGVLAPIETAPFTAPA